MSTFYHASAFFPCCLSITCTTCPTKTIVQALPEPEQKANPEVTSLPKPCQKQQIQQPPNDILSYYIFPLWIELLTIRNKMLRFISTN